MGVKKSKVEVVLLTYMEPRSEGQKVKYLFWQNRVENLIFIILGRFSLEKTLEDLRPFLVKWSIFA